MSEVLRRAVMERTTTQTGTGAAAAEVIAANLKDDDVSYIVVKEVNFDDNGLTDSAFA